MSRKNFYIIITIVLIIFVLGLISYYFIITSGVDPVTGKPTGFRQFFPFGTTEQPTPGATTTPININPNPPTANYTQKLRKIWSEPVAGVGILDVKAGTVIRHIEVATGHIYETELFSPNQIRISNKTMPFIYNAVWNSKNKSFVAQYLKENNETVDSYVMTLKDNSTTTENIVSGFVLSDGLSDVLVRGNTIFYLKQNDAGTQGFVTAMDGIKRKQIWNSPLRELSSQFVNDTTVTLNTKPYPNIPGFLYTVNTSTGGSKKILGAIPGLSSLTSLDLLKVLYLSQTDSAKMFLYDVKNETSKETTPATFPEKCVWSKKDTNIIYCAVPKEYIVGESLTSWYMGLSSFSDDIWKYDIKQNSSNIIANLSEEGGEQIDVIKPQLSEKEQYLIFINKKNGSLWSLDLTK